MLKLITLNAMLLRATTLLSIVVLAIVLVALLIPTANAQTRFDQQERVIIYSECGFRGPSREVSFGDFRRMSTVGFEDNRLSSIYVPSGAQVTVYENAEFGGSFVRLDRSVSCFDRSWNNKVSSFRVRALENVAVNNSAVSRQGSFKATAANVSKVLFGGEILQQLDKNTWQFTGTKGRTLRLTELERGPYAVYLQNKRSGESARIDFFTDQVTIIGRRGQLRHIPIDQSQGNKKIQRPRVSQQTKLNQQATVFRNNNGQWIIRGRCFPVKAYTDGAAGGLRFSGHEGFHRYNKKSPYTSRLCHNGKLRMEISKTNPATNVVVVLAGQEFRFDRNEKEDLLLNTWYRKNVELLVRP